MRVVVAGAGFTGLTAALLLAEDGHDVTVLGSDSCAGEDSAAAPGADPRGDAVTYQRLLPPELSRELERALPHAHAGLAELTARSPAGNLTGGGSHDTGLVVHRTRSAAAMSDVARAAGLTVHKGQMISRLLTTGREPLAGRPRICGVLTTAGEALFADLVVDAAGRCSPVPRMLSDLGVIRPLEEGLDFGYHLHCVRFRLTGRRHGAPWSLRPGPALWSLAVRVAEDEWVLALGARDDDPALRPLGRTGPWHRVVSAFDPEVLPRRAVPFPGLTTVTCAESRRRTLVEHGEPVATGVFSIGSAWATCHPFLGVAASLGFAHATLLRDVLRSFADASPRELALAFDRLTRATLLPVHARALALEQRAGSGDGHGGERGGDADAGPPLAESATPLTRAVWERLDRVESLLADARAPHRTAVVAALGA